MNYTDIDKMLYTTQLPKDKIVKHVGSSHYILIPKFVIDETFLNNNSNNSPNNKDMSIKIVMTISGGKLKIELEVVKNEF